MRNLLAAAARLTFAVLLRILNRFEVLGSCVMAVHHHRTQRSAWTTIDVPALDRARAKLLRNRLLCTPWIRSVDPDP